MYVRAASGRQRYNVLGAFNATTHQLIRVANDTYITATTVCELLHKIAALGLGTPVTLVFWESFVSGMASWSRSNLPPGYAADDSRDAAYDERS
jgi:hypothetical protein